MNQSDSVLKLENFNGGVLEFDGDVIVTGDVFAADINVTGSLIVGGDIVSEDNVYAKTGNIVSGGKIKAKGIHVRAPQGSIVCAGKLSTKNIDAMGVDCGKIKAKGHVTVYGILRVKTSIKAARRVYASAALYAETVHAGWSVECDGITEVSGIRENLEPVKTDPDWKPQMTQEYQEAMISAHAYDDSRSF